MKLLVNIKEWLGQVKGNKGPTFIADVVSAYFQNLFHVPKWHKQNDFQKWKQSGKKNPCHQKHDSVSYLFGVCLGLFDTIVLFL